jgi:hypothetical protein
VSLRRSSLGFWPFRASGLVVRSGDFSLVTGRASVLGVEPPEGVAVIEIIGNLCGVSVFWR